MAGTPEPHATVSTLLLTRFVIGLLALWNLLAGLALLAFHGSSANALGAGVSDEAGQRVLGAHFIVLVPAYLMIAWRGERYRSFFWLPLAAQIAVVLVVGYGMIAGETDFGDGILAFAVGLIFVFLLGFLWITEQRTLARLKLEAQQGALPGGEPAAEPPEAES
jgi:hypothetical protein